MSLFSSLRKKRALKRYARELPRQLRSDYGAGEFFTPAQIKAATSKLKVDQELIVYGYAGFLSEETFGMLPPQTPDLLTYEEVRSEFLRLIPSRASSSSNFYESGIGLRDGDGGNGHSDHH